MTLLHPNWLPTDEEASSPGRSAPVIASGTSRYAGALVGILFVLCGLLLYLTREAPPVVGASVTREHEEEQERAPAKIQNVPISSATSSGPPPLPKNPFTVKQQRAGNKNIEF